MASSAWCVKARDPLNCSYRVIHAPESLSISAARPIIQYIEPLSGRPNSTYLCVPSPLYLTAAPHGTPKRSTRNLDGKESEQEGNAYGLGFVFS